MPLDTPAGKGKFDKSKLPSRHVSVGPDKAPHRSYYYAMGLSEEEIAMPFVGVATCWNEAAPCNISLSRQAQVVKLGRSDRTGTDSSWASCTVFHLRLCCGATVLGGFLSKFCQAHWPKKTRSPRRCVKLEILILSFDPIIDIPYCLKKQALIFSRF